VFNKKTSNSLGVMVMLWTFSIVSITTLRLSGGAVIADPATMGAWFGEISAGSLVPLLVIYANKRQKTDVLPLLDQVLQLLFYVTWVALGLCFIFNEGSPFLLIFAGALVVLVAIILRAIFVESKKAKQRQNSGGESSRTALLLAFDVLTMGVPLGYLVGMMTYTSALYPDEPDAGLLAIPIMQTLAPIFLTGVLAAIATLIWLAWKFLKSGRKARASSIVLGALWALASVAYLVEWVRYLAPTIFAFHLL
jgi:hypothetical protein